MDKNIQVESSQKGEPRSRYGDLATDFLAGFSLSAELKQFIKSTSTLGPGSWSKVGQANRSLAALELAYPDRQEFFGLAREKFKLMLSLQEVLEPFKLATVPESLKVADMRNRYFKFEKLGLSNDDVALARALRSSLELFKRGFLSFKFGSTLQQPEVFAECLKDINTHTNLSPGDFYNFARLWISLFVVSRSGFSISNLGVGSKSADLEFLLEQPVSYRQGRPQLDQSGHIRLSPGMTKILEAVGQEMIR